RRWIACRAVGGLVGAAAVGGDRGAGSSAALGLAPSRAVDRRRAVERLAFVARAAAADRRGAGFRASRFTCTVVDRLPGPGRRSGAGVVRAPDGRSVRLAGAADDAEHGGS